MFDEQQPQRICKRPENVRSIVVVLGAAKRRQILSASRCHRAERQRHDESGSGDEPE
jgi:hypothetical protein